MVSEYTRATDGDRNDICQALDAALSDGQLSAEEHRERVSRATKATTLGELESLVGDLQVHPTPDRTPVSTPPVSRRVWIAAALALVLVGFGLTWALNRAPAPSSTSAPSTSPSGNTSAAGSPSTPMPEIPPPPPQLLTLSGVTGVLAQMRTQFGDTLGLRLVIYQEHAVLERPDTANARKLVTWYYHGGSFAIAGPQTAISSRLAVGDVSKFDVQAVLGVVQQAPQTLHIYDANQIYLTIEARKDGGLSMRIHVSDGPLGGAITVNPDGSVTDISPPAH